MSVWAAIFLDFWKRKNAEVAYDWDVRDYEAHEPIRPQFKSNDTRVNPITGDEEKVGAGCLLFVVHSTDLLPHNRPTRPGGVASSTWPAEPWC